MLYIQGTLVDKLLAEELHHNNVLWRQQYSWTLLDILSFRHLLYDDTYLGTIESLFALQ